MVNVGSLVLAAALPVIEVVLMCGTGAAARWKGWTTPESSMSLSKLIYYIFLPSLIFVSLGTSVTGSRLLSWWPVPVNVAFNVVLGMALGWAAARLVGTPRHLRGVFICAAGVGAHFCNVMLLTSAVSEGKKWCVAHPMLYPRTTHLSMPAASPLPAPAYIGEHTSPSLLPTPSPLNEHTWRSGNLGNLPLVLVPAIAAQSTAFGAVDEELGLAYVFCGLFAVCVAQFAVVPQILRKPIREPHVTEAPLPIPAEGDGRIGVGAEGAQENTRSVELLAREGSDQGSALQGAGARKVCAEGTVWPEAVLTTDSVGRGAAEGAPSLSTDTETEGAVGSTAGSPSLQAYPASIQPDGGGKRGGGAVPSLCGHAVRRTLAKAARITLGLLTNAPTAAIIVGVAVAVVTPVREVFFGTEAPGDAATGSSDRAPLAVLTSALRRLGGAMIPALMVNLGGALLRGPGSASVPWPSVAALAIIRLVLLPVLGAALVLGARAAGIWVPPGEPGDPGREMFTFLMLLLHAMPSALNMHTVTVMLSGPADEVAALLFWQYMACILTIPVCVGVFLGITT